MDWGWQQAIAAEGQAAKVQRGGGAGLAVCAACVLHAHRSPLTTHSTPDLPPLQQSCRTSFGGHMTKEGCVPVYIANTMLLGITPNCQNLPWHQSHTLPV